MKGFFRRGERRPPSATPPRSASPLFSSLGRSDTVSSSPDSNSHLRGRVADAPASEAPYHTGFSQHGPDIRLDRQQLYLALEPLKPFFIRLADLTIERSERDARGGFGIVRVATLLRAGGSPSQKVAVKEFASGSLPLRIAFRIAREMTVWSRLNHPNVLPFTGYHLSDALDIAYLVCPFIEQGNVKDYLRKYKLDLSERADLVQDTLNGLKYLHSINVCHGDLKALNVLVSNKRRAMLCDFGLASLLRDDNSIGLATSTGFKGTSRWCSPQLLDNEIMTGDVPYHDLRDVAVLNWIIVKKRTPASGTKSCKSLPKGMLGLWDLCWSFSPLVRPDAATCARAWPACWNKAEWQLIFLNGAPSQPLIVPDAAFGKPGTELHLDRQKLDLAPEPLKPFFIPLANLQTEISAGDARGGYGVVHVAKLLSDRGSSPQKVAVKDLTSDLARTIPLRMAFRIAREMTVWCKLSHPNILPFTGYHLSVDMNIAYLVCPFMDEGNIRSYLLKHNPDRNERARFVQDTVDGLEYLHAIDVCHGDLKSFNVLVTDEKRAMLCDFGLASLTHDQPTGLTTTTGFNGSFRWCSPELLNNFPRDLFSDIWAWACVALEIVTGDFPYNDIVHDVAVVNWITKKCTPASATKSCEMLPKGMLGLWELCWSFDPLARPDAATCAKAWSVCWNKVEWRSSFLEGASSQSASVDIVVPREYLIKAQLLAEKEDEIMRPAYIRRNAAGALECENRVERLVHKGAILRKGQRLISKFCKYSVSPRDQIFEAVLYTSESDRVPRYTDEGSISELCRWRVDLSKLRSFQENSRTQQGGFFTNFELGLELDSAEVRWLLLQDGEEFSPVIFDP